MAKARIYIDFNEMVSDDIILLSKEDSKTDSLGNVITFYEGMPVSIYSDDASATGEIDPLIAEGIAIKYDLQECPHWKHVKWCVRIDLDSLMHESDLKFLQTLPLEIKKHPHELLVLREFLVDFKNHGMDKNSMLKNLERLRYEHDSETETILLDLMDFVTGWCRPDLSI